MVKEKNILAVKKHGIDFPEWLWNMCAEGKLRLSLPSRTAYIKMALINQAKIDGIWEFYSRIINEQVNTIVETV